MLRDLRTIGWAIALLGLGCVLSAIPLFDLLGYEFTFALGLAAAVCGAHLGAAGVFAWRVGATPS